MFCSLRLHRFVVCWLTLRLSNNPFIRLMLDTHLLCSLPLFRPIILPSSVTSNSKNDCQHLLHTECLKVLELISFPCLRCCADSCIFLQGQLTIFLQMLQFTFVFLYQIW
ncbi:unnamed protein product [Trichobilharzia regenti]|nr:unnamed protein product [Trichobilharzia regenti]